MTAPRHSQHPFSHKRVFIHSSSVLHNLCPRTLECFQVKYFVQCIVPRNVLLHAASIRVRDRTVVSFSGGQKAEQYEVSASTEAQTKFGNAKAISSNQFFGNNEPDVSTEYVVHNVIHNTCTCNYEYCVFLCTTNGKLIITMQLYDSLDVTWCTTVLPF